MRIFPEMWPKMTCPFSSLTRKVALGRVSMISPCIWITSSFAIFAAVALPSESGIEMRPMFSRYLPGGKARPLEIGLLEQALVLVRHDVGLHLRHEVHRHHNDDEKRGAAEVERHVPPQNQKLRQQADQCYVDGARQDQSQEDLLEILRRLLPGPYARNEGARLLQIVRRLFRIVLQRRIEKTEENDRACVEHDVHRLARRKRGCEVPDHQAECRPDLPLRQQFPGVAACDTACKPRSEERRVGKAWST